MHRHVATVRLVSPDDSLLVDRIAAGDDRALAAALDGLGGPVFAAALQVLGDRAAAEDVVQDVFVGLWCHPERYDGDRGSLRAYLVTCGRHRAHDLLRSELRRIGREERLDRLTPRPRPPSPLEQVGDADAASAVHAAVRQLPPEQQQVVELAYFRGLSYREVALATGLAEGTAKSRVRLALAKLETLLDRQLLESS
jgi:RNA polymerase sigma-70 factor (ECF subfamily)